MGEIHQCPINATYTSSCQPPSTRRNLSLSSMFNEADEFCTNKLIRNLQETSRKQNVEVLTSVAFKTFLYLSFPFGGDEVLRSYLLSAKTQSWTKVNANYVINTVYIYLI